MRKIVESGWRRIVRWLVGREWVRREEECVLFRGVRVKVRRVRGMLSDRCFYRSCGRVWCMLRFCVGEVVG